MTKSILKPFLFLLFPLLGLTPLGAIPIKVPTERYKNFEDLTKHPGLYPFISHLTFRAICDKSIDEMTEWFDPESVRAGGYDLYPCLVLGLVC